MGETKRHAYETLSDEAKRRRYDEELARQGSEVRITRVPEIIEGRRSLLMRLTGFSPVPMSSLKGSCPASLTSRGKE
jgi:curved DNA-binding protein CbpA